MSRRAVDYFIQHLPEVRRLTYTEPNGKTRGIGETGVALLAYLCDHANKNGTVFMTAESMREDTGTATVREIRRLLAGFEQIGVLTRTGELVQYLDRGRPTPEYALTWVPGLWKQDTNTTQNAPIGAPEVSQWTPEQVNRKALEPLSDKGSSETNTHKNEPEPEPQPEPQPKTNHGTRLVTHAGPGDRGGREWSSEHEKLLEQVLYYEPKDHDRGKLVDYLRREYEPIIVHALKEKPHPDLVSWCIETRRMKYKPEKGYLASSPRELAPWEKANPACPECDGGGMSLEHGPDGTTKNRLCDCTKDPHLRVVS